MGGTLFSAAQVRQFRRLLLAWYDAHARDLPWRRTRDPYAIWVSEIMLQQTRVNAVLDHYARFMERFPTVQDLAKAKEEEVLARWSGLGYYRRARMMHKAAKVIVTELDGSIPQSRAALQTLPGIGVYTSAAIASIAFGEAVAVVDGNVERVIQRLSSSGEAIAAKAQALLDPVRPGDFNQAMMELGATVCLPKNPLCLQCVVQKLCRTRGEHPVAPKKAALRKHVCYAFVKRGEEVLLEQRPHDASLMAGMWELPQLEETLPGKGRPLLRTRHSITVTHYSVDIFALGPDDPRLPVGDRLRRWIRTQDLPEFPLTGLTRKVLKRLYVLNASGFVAK
ncbi:A/G-specific adenine glycosylase [Pseudacidobacterium ailaaui]|uniref:A/G-specific adenine glycosylase n=1 Tax=Pseudacidobacterium ailaaui TaxID=1382359 RepID=UPI0005D1AEB2|nr:A/G-specific adenine glycosylase [Pseudacidobacterium ailaaui]